jgi:predicted transcriptional regulator
MVTSEQVKAARALLGWGQKELAAASGVSLPSIGRLEMKAGQMAAYPRTQDAIRASLEAAGIEFLHDGDASPAGGAGVRLKAAGPA